MSCHLLIPAAGKGTRMGSDRNKLLLPLLDRPILAWTLLAAIAAESIGWIGVIGQPYDLPDFEKIFTKLASSNPHPKPIQWIQGGTTRQESVYNGLQALPAQATKVLIHDGARCLATPTLFDRCDRAFADFKGFIAAIPIKDTIKVVQEQKIVDTPNRDHLWAAQTPQGFLVDPLKQAHAKAKEMGWAVTDDAALFEKVGLPVSIVAGEETNLKVTTPQDLAIAEFILNNRQSDMVPAWSTYN
jgi:2-C-methyl-D-erythritol 4-phosphate cytidylyltransferase